MTTAGQLIAELPAHNGRRAAVIAASRDLEPGARAMLLQADGLFRLDVRVQGDSLQTVVRGLSPAPVADLRHTTPSADAGAGGEIALDAGVAGLEFAVGVGEDRVEVSVTIGTVRFADRGLVRVSGQAIVRQPPP
jgi:hypothetical protein